MTDIPTIKVLISPLYYGTNSLKELLIELTISVSDVVKLYEDDSRFQPLITLNNDIPSIEVGTTLNNFAWNLIESKFDVENVALDWETKSNHGIIKISYLVHPSTELHPRTDIYPWADLRLDQGGIIGSGRAFITLPVSRKITRNIVEWNLGKAPKGTRAVWTFGEGPGLIEKVGPVSLLSDSVYMVGPIQSNPPAPIPGSISDYYGYYWFGDLPPNISVIKDIHYEFFLKVSTFFDDTPSPDNPYRSFIRSNQKTNSFGGTGFTRSHIFDYDSHISLAQDYDLIRRLSYEIVHNFLGPLPHPPSPSPPGTNWLYEGIKNTLSIYYFPFRLKFRTGDYFSYPQHPLPPILHLLPPQHSPTPSPNPRLPKQPIR
jgi:hypothetical protein